MVSHDEVRVSGRPNPAMLCSECDGMPRAVTAHTDGSLMPLAVDRAAPHGPVDIAKIDEAVAAIWRVVCEQNISFVEAVT